MTEHGRRDFNAECPERPGVSVGEDLVDKWAAQGITIERLTRERDDALAESRRWAERWAIGGEHHSILLVVEGLERDLDEARRLLQQHEAGAR